jgi:L-iditol 2-dehydrogenase
MGLLHVALLRVLWPRLAVVAVESIEERRRLAERLGAAAAAAPGEHAARVVRDLTAGLGADLVFDTVGGAALLDAALALGREGGTVVLFAHAAPGERAGFDLNALFKHERRVVATYSGGLSEQSEVYDLLVSGRLDPSALVTHRLPLAAFGEAVELVRSRRALKVLLVPGEDRSR